MREEFALGLMQPPGIKKFVITDDKLIYGKEEFSYGELSNIRMLVTPSPITNGVAQVVIGGRPKQLAYKFADRERAAQAFAFANGKINAAKGIVKNCKYELQAHTGTSLEVYDTYLVRNCSIWALSRRKNLTRRKSSCSVCNSYISVERGAL